MTIIVVRYSRSNESTLGLLLINWQFYCYTLEDPTRNEKIPTKTAIPSGAYPLTVRWSNRFGRRLLAVQNVPYFTDILIHPLNVSEETDGCIGVGQKTNNNRHEKGRLYSSRLAHDEIFEVIAPVIDRGEEVQLVIGDPIELFKYENQKEEIA